MTALRRPRPVRVIVGLVLLAVGILMLAPLVWLIVESFTKEQSAFSLPPNWLPKPFTTDNFRAISGLIPFGQMAVNSVVVAVISTVGSMLVSILAGYAFSRLSFRGRQPILLIMLSALMVPAQTTIIPVFATLGWSIIWRRSGCPLCSTSLRSSSSGSTSIPSHAS